MKLFAYYLDFNAPLHIGVEGIGQESVETTIHSDTLWGAIVQCWILLFGTDPIEICTQSPFRISSCFPFIGGQMFFPLPVGALDLLIEQEEDLSRIKKIKKIKYISDTLFFQVIKGQTLVAKDLETENSCWPPLKDEKINQISKTIQRPRLEIDRLSNNAREGQFFYCTDQYFSSNSGLSFLVQCDDQQSFERFEASIRLLADYGIGADRSVGRGTFSFRKSIVELPSISEHQRFCLLSLYHPTHAEVTGGMLKPETSAYTVLRRSGQCGTFGVDQYRRADLWMLAEGSMLSQRPIGDIPCVLPKTGPIPHSIYRYGMAMAVPMEGCMETP
jgi:CRISPR-associated protein Csm4